MIPFMIKQYRYSMNFDRECEYDRYKDKIYNELHGQEIEFDEKEAFYTHVQVHKWMEVFGGTGRLRFKNKKEFKQAMIKIQKEFTFIDWVKQDLRKNKLDNILN